MLSVAGVLSSCVGCLGDRYEKNVPAANLQLWDAVDGAEDGSQDPDAGRPRFRGNGAAANRGTRGTGGDRGTQGVRGTAGRRGTQGVGGIQGTRGTYGQPRRGTQGNR